MADPYYSSPAEVRAYTGVTPARLELETDAALDALLVEWLADAKDLIDADRNRDFLKEALAGKLEKVPRGIANIAKRIVANMVAQAMYRRETGIVKLGDYEFATVRDSVFTSEIKSDLERYARGIEGVEDKPANRTAADIPLTSQFWYPGFDPNDPADFPTASDEWWGR